MSSKYEYIIGNVYNTKRLLSLFRNEQNRLCANVECISCGKTSIMRASDLFNKRTTSCMCKNKSVNSEYINDKLYSVYHNMKYRCFNSNAKEYYNYGGKGITVCDEWLGEFGFINFRNWSLNNGYKEGLSIDRIDENGNYCPQNCQWITLSENVIKANKTCQHRMANKGLYYGIDPNGKKYYFENANLFAKQNNLYAGCVRQVANGKKKSYKGWKFGFAIEEISDAKFT